MSAVVRECSFAELSGAPNFGVLTAAYAAECALAGLPEPRAHIDLYLKLEAMGVMHTFCAYLDDELIGFAIALVSVIPHYSEIVATMESWFVAAEHRKSGAGMLLQRAVEDVAREKGALGLLISAPMHSQLANVMTARAAYRETNRVFFRAFT